MFEFTKDRFEAVLNGKLRFNQIAIAFQPIVDVRAGRVWGYEALTRGARGESYPAMTAGMNEDRRRAFDKLTTMKALSEAARLGLVMQGARLTLNVRPTVDLASVDAAFVNRTAKHFGIPTSAMVLELTEDAKLSCEELNTVMDLHRSLGIKTGIDDFGSGYSGLNVLATCGADMVKLDRQLVSGVDMDRKKQMIVESFTRLCGQLGSLVVAEGIETRGEAETLRRNGITLMQGYYFGKPVVGELTAQRVVIGEGEPYQGRVIPFESAPMRLLA
jgi:EAL domain-containing protein (putative c-di-GMP-specific phosphodiesterase class I)